MDWVNDNGLADVGGVGWTALINCCVSVVFFYADVDMTLSSDITQVKILKSYLKIPNTGWSFCQPVF